MRTATVALVLGVLLEAFVFGQDGRAVNAAFKGNLVTNQTNKDLAAARVGKPIILRTKVEEYDYEQDQEQQEEEEDEEEEEEEEEEIHHTTQRSKGDKQKRKKNKRKGVAAGVSSGGGAAGSGSVGGATPNYKGGYKGGSKGGLKKHLKKYMFPLLLAYKLKFLTLIPLLIGGLVLIVASTGFAGFFFALFAVGVGLKKD